MSKSKHQEKSWVGESEVGLGRVQMGGEGEEGDSPPPLMLHTQAVVAEL